MRYYIRVPKVQIITNKHYMKEVELNKDGYIQEVKEWTPEDISDFLSDFCSVSDENSIHIRASDIYQDRRNSGLSMLQAQNYADGYEQALLDILKQM